MTSAAGRRVLEDPAEVAEADGRVHALGHRRGLQARGRAAALRRVVDETCRERGAEPPAARGLERADVEQAAVAGVVEADRGRDALAGEPRHEDVEGAEVGAGEQVGGHPDDPQVLVPLRRPELDCGPRGGDVVERHAHSSRGLLEDVAAALQLGAHPRVALVDPRGVAVDARGLVLGLHRVDGRRACGRAQPAVEHRVIVDRALGAVREHGGRDAVPSPQRRSGATAREHPPCRQEGRGPARVEVVVGDRGHRSVGVRRGARASVSAVGP